MELYGHSLAESHTTCMLSNASHYTDEGVELTCWTVGWCIQTEDGLARASLLTILPSFLPRSHRFFVLFDGEEGAGRQERWSVTT